MLRRQRDQRATRSVEAPTPDRLSELADAEARRVAERDRIEAERASVQRELDAFPEREAAVYLGEDDADAVRRHRAELRGRMVELDAALSENSRAGGVLQRLLAAARQAAADEREVEAKRRWLQDLAIRNEAAHALAEHVRAADVAAADLQAARATEAASRRGYEKAVVAAGREIPPLLDIADEPGWVDGVSRLQSVLGCGPLRPVAEKREHDQRAAAEREVQRQERVRWIERHGTRRDLEGLRPDERARIEAAWEAERPDVAVQSGD